MINTPPHPYSSTPLLFHGQRYIINIHRRCAPVAVGVDGAKINVNAAAFQMRQVKTLLLPALGVALIVSCSYNGDVRIRLNDSFRMLSPDLDARMRAESEITDCDDLDSERENCLKKKLEKAMEN